MKADRLQKIYFKLPVSFQNLVVTLYGYRLSKVQRGKKYRQFLSQIYRNIILDRNELNSLQLNKLKQIISLCEINVPYYRDLFKRYSITADKINALEDLKRIPLLDKGTVRKNPIGFVSEQYKYGSLFCINTSGTTGTPLKIYYDTVDRQLNYAFYDRFLSMADIKYNGKKATFGGRLVVPVDQELPPFWRLNHFQRNLMFSSYHIKPDHFLSYIRKLKEWSPDFIEAYPSTLSGLARFVNQSKTDGKKITKAIVTSAETLLLNQRLAIEAAFNVPVIDQYGSAEMAAFIGQCKEGRYHVHPDFGIVEFLRPDGSSAKPGEEAEIVCTGFVNMAMPLLRYRIGDRCIFSDQHCRCGLHFPVVDRIIGRMDDVIYTPDGRAVSRFGAVLYEMPVKEVQYVQPNVGQLIVKIVKDIKFIDETERIIEKELRKRLGNEIRIIFEYTSYIDRGPGGKLKTIVSRL